MKFGLGILFSSIILGGCLGKLETMTDETRAEVRNSNEKIERSIYKGELSQYYSSFGNPVLDQVTRIAGFRKLLEQGPETLPEQPLLFGASRPLTIKYPEVNEVPNVTFVSQEQDATHKKPSDVSTVDFTKLEVMRKGCLGHMDFLLLEIRRNQDTESLKPQAVRTIRICSAVFGAIPFNVDLQKVRGDIDSLESSLAVLESSLSKKQGELRKKQAELKAQENAAKAEALEAEILKLTFEEVELTEKREKIKSALKKLSGERSYFSNNKSDRKEGVKKLREIESSLFSKGDPFREEIQALIELKIERNDIQSIYNWQINR